MSALGSSKQDNGWKQEERQKLGVSHVRLSSAWKRRLASMARGYQRGVVATVPATLVSSILAALNGWPSPVEPLAEYLMQSTPVPVAEFLFSRFEGMARPAALLGALAMAMLAGGLAGVVQSAAGRGLAREVGGYLAGSALLAAVFLPLFPPYRPEPTLVFLLLFVLFLALMRVRRRVSGRREFLERSGVIFAGAAGLIFLFAIEPVLSRLSSMRLFGFQPARGLPVEGLSPLVTSTDSFYIMDKVLEPPVIDVAGWRLEIDGLVTNPQQVDFASLMALPRANRFITCECVDNPVGGSLIGTALWTGVRIDELLRRAGPQGDSVIFHAADSYSESAGLDELRAAGALIVLGMNGQTLSRRHGYPARLILPGAYGFKSVKWLTGIEIVAGSHMGTWHEHGWTEDTRIRTTTRIDVARRNGDRIEVAGIAFAGTRGVRAVELRVNAGPWFRARLGPALSAQAWVQWAVILRGTGPAHIEARAVDGSGRAQEARRHGSYPDGASGWATFDV
jgi:DMSO/TMAO reductase YedYZ molybdopterin-dependent catalytic subunit